MNITLNIKLDDEVLSALNGIAAALANIQGRGETPSITGSDAAAPRAEKQEAEDKGPFLWANHKTGAFGKVASKAAYDKLKAKDADVVRLTEAQYKDKQAKAEAAKKAEATKTANAEAEKATKPAKTDTKAVPEKAELIEAFSSFLPKDLGAEERTERREFVTALLQRFGATKVSTLDESQWALAIEMVTRKSNGEDVDPTEANFDQFDDAAGESDVDDMI